MGNLVNSIFVAFFQTYWLKGLTRDSYHTVAQRESQLAQTYSHIDAHEHADQTPTWLDDLPPNGAEVEEADETDEHDEV